MNGGAKQTFEVTSLTYPEAMHSAGQGVVPEVMHELHEAVPREEDIVMDISKSRYLGGRAYIDRIV